MDSGEARYPSTLRVTISLMQAAAQTEREIAETLRDMAAQAHGEIAARRRKLAEEAAEGALQAERHGRRLQQLAGEWAEHADVVKLHRLLAHASRALTGLAQTQQDIADTFDRLAGQDVTALAAQRRQLAVAAAASARNARKQARDLQKLAETSAAGVSPARRPPTRD